MYCRAPFLRATNLTNGAKRKFVEIIFTKQHWEHPLQYMGTYVHEIVFGETNFVEVPKILKICEIYGPQKKRPTV